MVFCTRCPLNFRYVFLSKQIMKTAIKCIVVALMAIAGHFLFSSFLGMLPSVHVLSGTRIPPLNQFPYRQAGLTERQAAAHLVSRFTYGVTPGQIDDVVHMGLEKWFLQQLDGNLPDDSVNARLSGYDALNLSNEQAVNTFPRAGELTRMAVRDGYVNKDSVRIDKQAYRDLLRNYMQEKGLRPEQDLIRQFICQKVVRAAYSQNQLREVMTDFWFNHFNVSITKNDCSVYIPAYERDIIRPGVFGHFGDLLLQTARSPAMLYYLDNFSSAAPVPEGEGPSGAMIQGDSSMTAIVQKARKARGLNENYAREVMELHTLGVDGGYTQQDVTQAARVLTGWTVYPMRKEGKDLAGKYGDDRLARKGFVHDGDFWFNANRHDKGEKMVLGKHFGPNGGYQEGVELLYMLAHHPSTAGFIARKIAVRFVCDNPPQSLIDKMAKTFLAKDGDIRQVLITMVNSPEFWSTDAVREKTKSPFELAIGAVRALHGQIDQPFQLYNWVAKMGEKKYYYQAPTGFPDKGSYWINTGSLLYRMNFGLALAGGKIPGVRLDLASLNNYHEPESPQSALEIYASLIMPERDLNPTIRRLTPMLNDPALQFKLDKALSGNAGDNRSADKDADADMYTSGKDMYASGKDVNTGKNMNASGKDMNAPGKNIAYASNSNPMLSQVVGIIIGSPEFQRR